MESQRRNLMTDFIARRIIKIESLASFQGEGKKKKNLPSCELFEILIECYRLLYFLSIFFKWNWWKSAFVIFYLRMGDVNIVTFNHSASSADLFTLQQNSDGPDNALINVLYCHHGNQLALLHQHLPFFIPVSFFSLSHLNSTNSSFMYSCQEIIWDFGLQVVYTNK